MGNLDALARALMEARNCSSLARSSHQPGDHERPYANFNARKNVMAISHNAFKSARGVAEM